MPFLSASIFLETSPCLFVSSVIRPSEPIWMVRFVQTLYPTTLEISTLAPSRLSNSSSVGVSGPGIRLTGCLELRFVCVCEAERPRTEGILRY